MCFYFILKRNVLRLILETTKDTHPVMFVTADLLAEALLLKGWRNGTLAAAIGAANRGDKAGVESVEQYGAKAKTKPK